MTDTARKVLIDCRYSHELLELEDNPRKFRLLWVSCTSLLRTVGKALHEVDAKNNPHQKSYIAEWWENLKKNKDQHTIFFNFIEPERNNILKEYKIGMFSGEVSVIAGTTGEAFTLSETMFCPITYGAFEGEDCRDIALQAIKWWEVQIDSIEKSCPSP